MWDRVFTSFGVHTTTIQFVSHSRFNLGDFLGLKRFESSVEFVNFFLDKSLLSEVESNANLAKVVLEF